jgi:hypothetical protein
VIGFAVRVAILSPKSETGHARFLGGFSTGSGNGRLPNTSLTNINIQLIIKEGEQKGKPGAASMCLAALTVTGFCISAALS